VAALLAGRVDVMTQAHQSADVVISDAERRVGTASAAHQAALAVHAHATDALHAAELALAGVSGRARELVGSHEITADDISAGSDDPETETRNIEDLERRRRMIGAVNELATGEWEETSGRTEEIAEQVADLEAAAADLAAHMQGLDDAVTDGFQQVFGVVQQRFRDAVEVLFPGGQGRLEPVECDDDELGIEIQVVPAGKRPRRLAMMSGGERSLIALAFCLAIAMTRPAPFYLLDEVEAALDDTNLRRFLALVRRLSEETQFVMITHQQPTVEIADTLFGITMGTDGTSQIVSRRLGDDIEGAARPVVRRQLKAIQGGRA
jgi:chromosome segregation protein